jgi:predicted N-acetyltransferase YhbS
VHVIEVEPHTGAREELRPLFELAEDSRAQLDAYLAEGRVLVARDGGRIVGHLQLTDSSPATLEIRNMAVDTARQGQGVGRALVTAALELAAAERRSRVIVATGAAGTGNLRFYQRLGFRMRAVERDAFTAATGYEEPMLLDGIELRDRVWLDRPVP